MEYIVTSNKKVCGKVKGEKLTESEIVNAGGEIKHLLEAGHIQAANKVVEYKKEVKEEPKKEIKEEVQVLKEETEAFVFNTDNYEGDK